MAGVPLWYRSEPGEIRKVSAASLVEGLGVERIRFLQAMGWERRTCGMQVMAVVPVELGK